MQQGNLTDIINNLNRCLAEDGRSDEIIKAATDKEFQQKLIKEYGLNENKELVEA